MSATIIHFPVADRMPTHIAESRIGGVISYGYPPPEKVGGDLWGWLERWLGRRSVLLGWEPVKEGLIKVFKSGRVRHLVSEVVLVDVDRQVRPMVEIACGIETYPVVNWSSLEPVKTTPVVILGADQVDYFRVCKKCEAAMRRRGL